MVQGKVLSLKSCVVSHLQGFDYEKTIIFEGGW